MSSKFQPKYFIPFRTNHEKTPYLPNVFNLNWRINDGRPLFSVLVDVFPHDVIPQKPPFSNYEKTYIFVKDTCIDSNLFLFT